MISSRVRSWSPVALLLGVLLVVGGLSAPAEATIKRSLSLRASASLVGAGKWVSFSGNLTNTPTGSQVRLQVKVGSYWLDSKFVRTTTAAGAYRTSFTAPKYLGKYSYRSVASAGAGRSSAVSPTVTITVMRRVDATLTASRTTVSSGGSVVLNGRVKPCTPGSTVSLQRYTSRGWATFSSPALSSQCGFSRTVRPAWSTSYRLSVPRHGSYAPTVSATVRITVPGPPPTITTTSLPAGTVGVAYSRTLTKTGGAGTWSRSAGTLPAGITLSSSTGKLSGTPTAAGTSNFTVRFTETSTGRHVSKALSIVVTAVGPVITTASLPDATRGAAYSTTLTKTGAAGSWSISSGALPTGITLDPSSGALTGTATVDGDFPVGVTFTETASSKHATKLLALHVISSPPPVITTTTVPDAVKGQAYSQPLDEDGNPGTWAVTQGALPPGITLNATTGVLSGTPSNGDDYGFEVTFTETAAQTSDSQTLLLHVSPAANSPQISTTSCPGGKVGTAYSTTLEAEGTGTWSISKFSLPPGLSLSAAGVISGTPTTPGDYLFQVKYSRVTIPFGTNTRVFTIHVDPA